MHRNHGVAKAAPNRRKRLTRKRRRLTAHTAGQGKSAGFSSHPGMSRPFGKDMSDLIQLVADTVCGYPNVWGVYTRPEPSPGEIVVVATPPVTRMVQYLLNNLAHHPSAVASGCFLHCEIKLADESAFRCIYRRFD